MRFSRSEALFEQAQQLIPGGVNSPVRAFRSVGGVPPFLVRGEGPYIWDEDGNRFIDFVGSWGPLILGHAHPEVVSAARNALERGSSFGAPTSAEVRLAEILTEAVPSIRMVRLVSSGTEAVMSALRLARAYTGRELIIKFEGCYHGHSDGLLARAGSGIATLGIPDVPGVPASFAEQTISLPFNNIEAVRQAMAKHGPSLAAVIVEPVAGNMGVVCPEPGFLEALREETRKAGVLLILDEVVTGFRVGRSGAQGRFGVTPDLTILGKIIGGGFPLAAYGGRREIMQQIAPSGPVYQAGTLSGNPVATAAGIATLNELTSPVYDELERRANWFEAALSEALHRAGVTGSIQRVGSMMTLFFREGVPRNYEEVRASDAGRYARFHRELLQRGVYFPPSAYEAFFISMAHAPEVLEESAAIAAAALEAIA